MGSLGWAPCGACGWWEYNPYIPDPYTHPFCGRCLTEVIEGRLQQCYRCGWWDWEFQGDSPVCEYCLLALTRQLRLALPQLPLDICARIVYWERYIDVFGEGWSTEGAVDETEGWSASPTAISV